MSLESKSRLSQRASSWFRKLLPSATHAADCVCNACWRAYPPLPSDNTYIRLLKLVEQGKYVLEVFELNHVIPFIAVSYAWYEETDQEELECTISVNGKSRTIAYNLWSFLHHKTVRTKNEYLWVDAICIDQRNLEERNHQVAIMRDIFSKASHVLAWLGEETTEIRTVFDAMSVAKKQPFDIEDMKQNNQVSRDNIASGLDALLRRKYWPRVWIVQEMILAQTLIVCCGNREIDSDMLREICCTRYLEQVPYPPIVFSGIAHSFQERFRDLHAASILQTRRDFIKARTAFNTTFEDIFIELATGRSCSDRRDHVFALLSLSSDPDLKADYSLQPKEVFVSTVSRRAVKRSVRLARSLFALICADDISEFNLDIDSLLQYSDGISVRVFMIIPSFSAPLVAGIVKYPHLKCFSFCTCDIAHEVSTIEQSVNRCGLTGIACITGKQVTPRDQAYWLPDSLVVFFLRDLQMANQTKDEQKSKGPKTVVERFSLVDVGIMIHLDFGGDYGGDPSFQHNPHKQDKTASAFFFNLKYRHLISEMNQNMERAETMLYRYREVLKTASVGEYVDRWSYEILISGPALGLLMNTNNSLVPTFDPLLLNLAERQQNLDMRTRSLEAWGATRCERDRIYCRCQRWGSYVAHSGNCARCRRELPIGMMKK